MKGEVIIDKWNGKLFNVFIIMVMLQKTNAYLRTEKGVWDKL